MQAHIFILGFVQGVGFRRFIKNKAISLGLNGWVKNLPDGRVEVLVQGPKEQIEILKKIAEKGTMLSDVKGVVVDWQEKAQDLREFTIIK